MHAHPCYRQYLHTSTICSKSTTYIYTYWQLCDAPAMWIWLCKVLFSAYMQYITFFVLLLNPQNGTILKTIFSAPQLSHSEIWDLCRAAWHCLLHGARPRHVPRAEAKHDWSLLYWVWDKQRVMASIKASILELRENSNRHQYCLVVGGFLWVF